MSDNTLHGYPRSGYKSDFYIQDLGTAEFYGLEFIDSKDDLIIQNQNITSKPNVLIEGNTILFDYSGSGIQKDKDYIDVLFKSMAGASGFTISTAIYNDPINNYTADLSASCTLSNYDNFKILGTFSTIGNTMETNYYQSRFFESVPQISSTIGLTSGVTLNSVINYTTGIDTSFLSQNFVIGDYIDIATPNNNARLTIAGITVDEFGREVLTFASRPRIIPENLKGVTTEVIHSRKVSRNTAGAYPTNTAATEVKRVNTREVDGKLLFTIDGVVQPALRLSRGVMYIFIDETFPLNSFLLSETPDGSRGGGIAYSDIGTYSVIDNKKRSRVFIMVPNDLTPNELFYYSENRSNMGSAIQVYGSYPYGETPASLTTNQQFNLQSSISNTNSSSVY
jgi:hypothetical protein